MVSQLHKKKVIFFILIFLIHQSVFSHVELTYPEGGETFKVNDTVTITWIEAQAHDTQNWEVYFSHDAGESWTAINTNIPVSSREFQWIVPEGDTKKGRIRVVQNNAETDYEDESANFSVEYLTGISDDSKLTSLFNSFYNYPNPFNNSTTFSFTMIEKQHLSIKLYNLDGSLVATLIEGEFEPGQHAVKWRNPSLKKGIYLYTIQVGEAIRSKKLQIIQ